MTFSVIGEHSFKIIKNTKERSYANVGERLAMVS